MPVYVFRCKECREIQEETIKYKDLEKTIPLVKCDKCGGDTTKLISACAVNTNFEGSYNHEQRVNPSFDSNRDKL